MSFKDDEALLNAARANAFLDALRQRGASGSAVFGNIAVGRVSHQGPNLNQVARDHNERHYPNTVRRIDALAARVVVDFSKGGLP